MNTFDRNPLHAPDHAPIFMNPDVHSFNAANLIRHQIDANRQANRAFGRHRADGTVTCRDE